MPVHDDLEKTKIFRINEENNNYQNCLMKIIKYNNANDIFVEFQDTYKAVVHGAYREFKSGKIKNPYFPEVYGMGMIGQKYKIRENDSDIKEYKIWHSMLQRCFHQKTKEKYEYYKNVTCCEKWLLFENFYEWLHEQENFEKWLYGERWALDKDILVKGNKIYSPDTCCLVPCSINSLFTKHDKARGELPIGVYYVKRNNTFKAQCNNPFQNNKRIGLGEYNSPKIAFKKYKDYKEKIIRKVAEIEFAKNNITKECYNAMMSYKVEITD